LILTLFDKKSATEENMPAVVRPIAKCGNCGKEFSALPGSAKLFVNGDFIVADFDCTCLQGDKANGVCAVAAKVVVNGTPVWMFQTEAGLQFEASKRGIDVATKRRVG
jgi:hypothetical protein